MRLTWAILWCVVWNTEIVATFCEPARLAKAEPLYVILPDQHLIENQSWCVTDLQVAMFICINSHVLWCFFLVWVIFLNACQKFTNSCYEVRLRIQF